MVNSHFGIKIAQIAGATGTQAVATIPHCVEEMLMSKLEQKPRAGEDYTAVIARYVEAKEQFC